MRIRFSIWSQGAILAIIALLIASCGSSDGGSPKGEGVDTSFTASDVRKYAAPVGAVGITADWRIRVASVNPDAEEYLRTFNPFLESPDPAETFFLVDLELTYVGSSHSRPMFDLWFEAIGETGVPYNMQDHLCDTYLPGSVEDAPEVWSGATTEMSLCFRVLKEDVDSLLLCTGKLGNPCLVLDVDPTEEVREESTRVDMEPVFRDVVPFGESVSVTNWTIRMVSADFAADPSMFDLWEPVGPGEQLAVFEIEAVNDSSEPTSFLSELSYSAVGADGAATGYVCDSDPSPTPAGGTRMVRVCWVGDPSNADPLMVVANRWVLTGERYVVLLSTR